MSSGTDDVNRIMEDLKEVIVHGPEAAPFKHFLNIYYDNWDVELYDLHIDECKVKYPIEYRKFQIVQKMEQI